MIPIISTQTFDVKDDDSGIIYKLRFLTDLDYQVSYSKLVSKQNKDRQDARTAALISIKEAGEEPTEDRINEIAAMIIERHREECSEEWFPMLDEYIDIFLCGWAAPVGMKIPEFPKDGKPSKMFSLFDKKRMWSMIIQNHHFLTGLTDVEVKN